MVKSRSTSTATPKATRPRTTRKATKPRKSRSSVAPQVSFEPLCRVCNGKPVADVTFLAVKGFVIFSKSQTFEGPFCRTCGEAVYRNATARTMLGCWWGAVSAGLGIRALISNRRSHKTLLGLAEPQAGDTAKRLDPGKRIWKRPGSIAGVAILVLIAFAIVGIAYQVESGPADLYQDRCVVMQESSTTIETVDCGGAHDGKVIGVVDTGSRCPARTDDAISLNDDAERTLCIDTDA